MAGNNNDGYAGVDIENIAVEKNIIVGMQAPNGFPCVKIDENGRSLTKMEIAENGGTQVLKSSGYECSCADTSWLAHCGKYSVSAGNKVSINAGGGGIQMTTTGPLKGVNCYTDLIATHGINLTTRLFTTTATKRMELTGSRIDINFDTTYIHGNVNFLGNLHVNGGMYVNGELICRHLTTQGQMNLTDLSDNLNAFINPFQSFTFFGGPNFATGILSPTPTPIAAMIKSPNPYMNGPASITLMSPIGLLPLSNLTFLPNPIPTTRIWSMAFLDQSADVKMPAHNHAYKTPACNFLDGQTDVFEQAKKLTESETPYPAKKTIANGQDALDMFKDQVIDLLKEHAKNWVKEWFTSMSPF